jgi:hypothetical protein
MAMHRKLRAARMEIEAIFAKYDLGGGAVVVTKGLAHSVLVVDPTWTATFRAAKDGLPCVGIVFPDPNDPKLADKLSTLRDTASMALVAKSGLLDLAERAENIAKEIGKRMTIQHADWLSDMKDSDLTQ